MKISKIDLVTSLAFGILVLIMFPSCKKQTVQSEPNQSFESKSPIQFKPFVYYEFGKDITEDDLILNEDDPLDEKFNRVEFALTLCMKELFDVNSPLLLRMIDGIEKSKGKCLNLIDFARVHPEINSLFNNIFAKRFSDFSTYRDWQEYIDKNYKYDMKYLPYVRLINNSEYIKDKPIYLAAPFEINEEKFQQFDDNIPLWVRINDVIKFTTLDETSSYKIDNPIIIVSNAIPGSQDWSGATIAGTFNPAPLNCNTTQHNHEYISHKDFKISERFEKTGKSEYTFFWRATKAYLVDLHNWEFNQVDRIWDTKICKADIGKNISADFLTFGPDMFDYPYCFEINMPTSLHASYAVSAFERDWYASYKKLFTTDWGVQGVGQRKYHNDWYFWNPDDNNSYDFATRHPTRHSSYINYTRGQIELRRWD